MDDRHDRRVVRNRAQVRLLASPVRQEVVDTLAALGGEAGVASLAEQLGRPADGLYYHLRALVAGGLVEEVPSENGERRFRLAGDGAGPLRLSYDLGPEGNAAELRAFVHGLLQIANRDFETALGRSDTIVAGPARRLWASRNKGWLDAADVVEVNALLARLGELTSQPRVNGRDHLVSLAFVLAPTDARPKRRKPRTSKAKQTR
ncbi:helix-turn-helix domain-containing protein [Sphingosinicella sp. BN140058]|uniref:winged helix-turn-helix domain-containing protein n=1 Tax=Sphingosinicella sp. BN140058 TaxID=1892855 RepID=UPI0010133A0C|nr:helix-turn-helix domain-containing protein [Sphingosinicella sp. BN140058]QAY75183.1 ArsR family transcriptional regulator [Sphingosinicella sp. BN140058]